MKFFRLAVLASLPLLSSCALLVGTEESTGKAGQSAQSLHALQKTEQQEVLRGAKLRLASIRRQIAVGKFTEAEAGLAPLANSSLYPEEVAELSAMISAGREKTGVLRVRKQIALARGLAYKDNFDEAEALLNMQDANGPCKVEIAEVRELLNLRRIKRSSKAVGRQVTEIRRATKRGDLAAAEAMLDNLESSKAAAPQVAALRLELQAAQDGETLSSAQQATVNQALSEVESRLILPKTYNKVIIISPNLDPVEMPVGSMEDLINKKVTIKLDNAGVKELVQVLSEVDGLNVIADDALEAEKTLTINVKDVPLKEILSYIARNMGIAFHMGENIVWVTESTEEPGSGPALETRFFQLRHGFVPTLKPQKKGGQEGGGGDEAGASDTDLEDALDAFLADSPEGASYRVFKTRNVLVVKDSRENLRLVEELVKTFDKPPLQVSIEALFLTISEDDLYDVGAEFSAGPDAIPTLDDANSMAQVTGLLASLGAIAEGNEDGIGAATFDGVIGNRTYNLVVSAIKKRGSTKNLSAPRVTLLNNQSARIERTRITLYYEELETVAGNGGDTTGDASVQTAFTGTPAELETGVTLDVKVNIGNNGETILLGLLPEITELARWRSFNVVAGNGTSNNNNSDTTEEGAPGTVELPETTKASVKTAVTIKSGGTVALGGLVTTTIQKTVSKVPILGDIPLVGFFFRHTNEKNVPQHLLVFVKATVINGDGNFVQVAE